MIEAYHASLLGAGLQSLGTRIFLDVSHAIGWDKIHDVAEIHAMLSLEFLKPGARFDDASLMRSGMVPPPGQLAVADRAIQLGGTAVGKSVT